MDKNTILQEKPSCRIKLMIELGQIENKESKIAGVLNELENGNFYDRYLCLMSCYGSKNIGRIKRFLEDDSRSLRVHAAKIMPFFENSEVIRYADKKEISDIIFSKKNKYNPDEEIILHLLRKGRNTEAAKVICSSNKKIIEKYINKFYKIFPEKGRLSIAEKYPEIILNYYLNKIVELKKKPYNEITWYLNDIESCIPILIKKIEFKYMKDIITYLIEIRNYTKKHNIYSNVENIIISNFGEIYRKDRKFATEFIKQIEPINCYLSNKNLRKIFRHISEEDMIPLANAFTQKTKDNIFRLIKSLPYDKRVKIYSNYKRELYDDKGVLPFEILNLLPKTIGEKEASAMIKNGEVVNNINQFLRFAGLLNYSSGFEILKKYIHNSDVSTRVIASKSLVSILKRNPEHREILGTLKEYVEDQDIVLQSIFDELGSISPEVLCNMSDYIFKIIKETTKKRDLGQSVCSMYSILDRMAEKKPEEVLEMYLYVFDARNFWISGILEKSIKNGSESRLYFILDEKVRYWMKNRAIDNLSTIAKILPKKKKLKDKHKIQQLKIDILNFLIKTDMGDDNIRKDAYKSIFSEIDKKEKNKFAIDAVSEYPSMLDHRLSSFIARNSTDFFIGLLKGKENILGVFKKDSNLVTKDGIIVSLHALEAGIYALDPEISKKIAEVLKENIEKTNNVHNLQNFMKTLSKIPEYGGNIIFEFLKSGDKDRRVAAIRVLSYLDSDRYAFKIFDYLEDDELVRDLIYNIGLLKNRAGEDFVVDRFMNVEIKKLTVKKEIIRIIGGYSTQKSFKLLERFREDTNKDIQISVLSGMKNYLDGDYFEKFHFCIASDFNVETIKSASEILHQMSFKEDEVKMKSLEIIDKVKISKSRRELVENKKITDILKEVEGKIEDILERFVTDDKRDIRVCAIKILSDYDVLENGLNILRSATAKRLGYQEHECFAKALGKMLKPENTEEVCIILKERLKREEYEFIDNFMIELSNSISNGIVRYDQQMIESLTDTLNRDENLKISVLKFKLKVSNIEEKLSCVEHYLSFTGENINDVLMCISDFVKRMNFENKKELKFWILKTYIDENKYLRYISVILLKKLDFSKKEDVIFALDCLSNLEKDNSLPIRSKAKLLSAKITCDRLKNF